MQSHRPVSPKSRLALCVCLLVADLRTEAADPSAAVAVDPAAIVSGAETVVTASRVPERASDSLSAVRVVTAQDLAGTGQLTLVEVLRQYAGVEIASAGGIGQPSSVFIRGASSSQTLVLVDGLRLGSATTGATALEHIPVSQIERIEVVAGPLSSLYGSDSIGGTIQIFTKGAHAAPVTEIALGAGSYDTARAQVQHGAHVGDFDYTMSAAYVGSGGFSATNPGAPSAAFTYNPDRDPYRDRNLGGHLKWQYTPDHSVGVRAFQSAATTHFDSGPSTDDFARQQLSQYALVSEDRFAAGWTSAVQVGESRDHYANFGAYPGMVGTVERQLSWQNTVAIPTGSLVAGAEYLHDRIDSDSNTPYTGTARRNRAVFGTYAGDFGAQGVRINLRREDNSQFGGVTSGALAYGYRVDPQFKLRASYGTGFHAPTFNDLYYPFGLGNPALQPERSRNRELGVDLDLAGQRLAITVFENRIHDMIVFDNTTFFQPFNTGAARIRGIETSYQAQLGATRVEVRATFQDPVDQATGLRLQRRATEFGSARASRSCAGTDFSAELVAAGARFDSVNQAASSRLGGYTLVNLLAARRLSPAWRAELRWNNVTAHHYELEQGYNTPGSNVFATLTWSAP